MSNESPAPAGAPTYTSQNFDAINSFFEHQANRHRGDVALQRANTIGIYLKWLVLATLAIGVVGFLSLWGMSLLTEKPEPRIVRPVVVDKAVNINVADPKAGRGGGDETSKAASTLLEISRKVDEIRQRPAGAIANGVPPRSSNGSLAPAETAPVVNFVIFKHFAFGRAGLGEVVVGMKYKDSGSKKPLRQWCYVNKGQPTGTTVRVDLASKLGSIASDRSLSQAEAREIGASIADLRAAQDLCAFE